MAPSREFRPSRCSSSSFVDRLMERYLAKHGDKDLIKVMPVFDPLHDLGQLIIAGRFDLPPDMVISIDHLSMLPRKFRKRRSQTEQEEGVKRTVFHHIEHNSPVEILQPAKVLPHDYGLRLTAPEDVHGQISSFPSDFGQREETLLQDVSAVIFDHQPTTTESHRHVYICNHPLSTIDSVQDEHPANRTEERSPALITYQEHIAKYKALREEHCDVEVNQLLVHHLNNNTLSALRKERFDPQSDSGRLVLGGRLTLPSGCPIPSKYRELYEEKTEEHRLARKAMLRVARDAIEAEKKVPEHQRSEINLSSAIRWLKADKYPMWDGRQTASRLRSICTDDSEARDMHETESTILSPKRSRGIFAPVRLVSGESAADLRISICVTQPPTSAPPTLQQRVEPVAVQTSSSIGDESNVSALSSVTSVSSGEVSALLGKQCSPPNGREGNITSTNTSLVSEESAGVLTNDPYTALPVSADSAIVTIPPSLILLSNIVRSKPLSPVNVSSTPSPLAPERNSRHDSPCQRYSGTSGDTYRTGRSARAPVVDRDIEDYQRYIAEYEALRATHCDPDVCAIFEHHMKNQTLATETMTTFDPQSDMGKLVLGGRSGLPSRCFVPPEYRRLLAERAEEHKQARASMLHVARMAFAAEYHVPVYQRSKINMSRAIYWLEKGKYPMWDPHRPEAGMRGNQGNERTEPHERDPRSNNRDNTRGRREREWDDRSAGREVPAAKRARSHRQEGDNTSRYNSADRVATTHLVDTPLLVAKAASSRTAKQHAAERDCKVTAAPPAPFHAPVSPLPVPPVVPSIVESVRLELAQMEKLYKEFMASD